MSKKVYGIDLGTTYSAISTLNDHKLPIIIENCADGTPLLASAVYFPTDGGNPVIGKEAKNQAEVEPEQVVQHIKREIGKPTALKRTFNGRPYSPIEISALILKRMREYVYEQEGDVVEQAIITCPAYFGNEEREATKQAGRIAGLEVLSIINEPTAAAINYCWHEFAENRKIMVYDLGGGTFDVTLVDFSVGDDGKEATVDVITTGGNDNLGGVDWDKRLENYLFERYCDKNGLSQDEMNNIALLQNIKSKVEEVKKKLSSLPATSFTINYANRPTRVDVTREQFEEITKDLVESTMFFVRKTLQDTKILADDVNVVLLVGGSTRMPMIQDAVKKMFPGEGRVIVEDPDLAVAKGAALAAHLKAIENIKEKQERGEELTQEEKEFCDDYLSLNMKVKDKLSRSFGVVVTVDKSGRRGIKNLVFVGDNAPSEGNGIFHPLNDGQEIVYFKVYENVSKDKYVYFSSGAYGSERVMDHELKVKYLGKLTLALPPNTPKSTKIEVSFYVSNVGVEVQAINLKTKEAVKAILSSENIFSEEEVKQKVSSFSKIKTSGSI